MSSGKRSRPGVPEEVRRELIRMAAKGATYRELVAALEVGMGTITAILRPLGGVFRPELWTSSTARLSIDDRIAILFGLEAGLSFKAIGVLVSRHASTVWREVNNNGGRGHYAPASAHRRAWDLARRPKTTKLAQHLELCRVVIDGLEKMWSPRQISDRLRVDFGDDATMSISHETIYKSLYVQGRGELRRELASCLRTGRAVRRTQGRMEKRGRIADMVMISDRPAEVTDRAVPGHWEGDLIIGKNGNSAIGTLVERATRFVILLHLPNGRTATEVREAMTTKIETLPDMLRRSITWDQGSEMAQHAKFTVETGIPVYFCDPHSPWQRGSNENTNGLLRQYFPKGTDLSVHSAEVLQAAADSLNDRPRQTLEFMKPFEVLDQLIASTG